MCSVFGSTNSSIVQNCKVILCERLIGSHTRYSLSHRERHIETHFSASSNEHRQNPLSLTLFVPPSLFLFFFLYAIISGVYFAALWIKLLGVQRTNDCTDKNVCSFGFPGLYVYIFILLRKELISYFFRSLIVSIDSSVASEFLPRPCTGDASYHHSSTVVDCRDHCVLKCGRRRC
jgi:hypothetical protein